MRCVRVVTVEVPNVVEPNGGVAVLSPGDAAESPDAEVLEDAGGRWYVYPPPQTGDDVVRPKGVDADGVASAVRPGSVVAEVEAVEVGPESVEAWLGGYCDPFDGTVSVPEEPILVGLAGCAAMVDVVVGEGVVVRSGAAVDRGDVAPSLLTVETED